MLKPLTKKQGIFCRVYHESGGDAGQAVRVAGYKYVPGREGDQGNAMLKIPHIAERIRMIGLGAADKTEETVASVARDLDKLVAEAVERGQIGAAVSATMGKAKLLGLVIERKQVAVGLTVQDIRQQLFGDLIDEPDLIEAQPTVEDES